MKLLLKKKKQLLEMSDPTVENTGNDDNIF